MWSLFDQPKKSFNKAKLLSSRKQLTQLFRDPLYANSSFLFANTVLGSGLGFVYWIIVAQLFSASEIGLGTALVAAARLLAGFSNSGLGLGIIRFLSQTSRERGNALINASLTFSVSIAVLVGSVLSAYTFCLVAQTAIPTRTSLGCYFPLECGLYGL